MPSRNALSMSGVGGTAEINPSRKRFSCAKPGNGTVLIAAPPINATKSRRLMAPPQSSEALRSENIAHKMRRDWQARCPRPAALEESERLAALAGSEAHLVPPVR